MSKRDIRKLIYLCPLAPLVEALMPTGPAKSFTCPRCDLVVWPGQKHPFIVDEFDVSGWSPSVFEDFVEILEEALSE